MNMSIAKINILVSLLLLFSNTHAFFDKEDRPQAVYRFDLDQNTALEGKAPGDPILTSHNGQQS